MGMQVLCTRELGVGAHHSAGWMSMAHHFPSVNLECVAGVKRLRLPPVHLTLVVHGHVDGGCKEVYGCICGGEPY